MFPEKLFCKQKGVFAFVSAVAFALSVLIYSLIPALSPYLFAVYLGFLLTVAFGADRKMYVHYITSLLCGFFWAFLYWNMAGWLMALGLPSLIAKVLGELICTFCLLYVHRHLLLNTWANLPPYCYALICSTFAKGGLNHAPGLAISIFFGTTACVLCEIIVTRLNAPKRTSKTHV